MRRLRNSGIAVAVATLCAAMTYPVVDAVAAAPPVVQLQSTSADLGTDQFVDSAHKTSTNKTGDGFLAFAEHRAPAKVHGTEGTASAFASMAATMETPGQPPLPTGPLNDIAVSGKSTAGATATGSGPAVPNSDSNGSLTVEFTVSGTTSVPVFFSGTLHTANTDAADSCSLVTVDLTSASFSRHFHVHTGDCGVTNPHQLSFAESAMLPADDYDLTVDYSSEVDDTVPGEARAMSASATVLVNLSFFPPIARFSTSLSGFTGHFDGATSSPGTAGRPIARWRWHFGDGRTATTTTPRVAHTYPTSPHTAPVYTVTLQVVDSGGSVSPPISHHVLGTATSVGVSKTSTKVTAAGVVRPRRAGHAVTVALQRRSHGRFRTLATHHPHLSSSSRYSTHFSRPAAGTCRIVSTYPGDRSHLASRASKPFAC